MQKNKSFLYLILLTIFIIFLFLILSSNREKYKLGALLGSKLPEFELILLKNNQNYNNIDIANIDKEYKLLNFFASWCSTCMMEHDSLLSLSERNDIEVIGVMWRDNPEHVLAWLDKYGDPYDILLMDKTGVSKNIFGLIGVPESFLLDKENNIIAHYRGPINLQKLNTLLDAKVNLVQ